MRFSFSDEAVDLSSQLTLGPTDRSINLFEIDSASPAARLGGLELESTPEGTGLITPTSFDGESTDGPTGIHIDGTVDSAPLSVTPEPVDADETRLHSVTVGGEDDPRLRFPNRSMVVIGSFEKSADLRLGRQDESDGLDPDLGAELHLYNRYADESVHADADTATLRLGSTDRFDPTMFYTPSSPYLNDITDPEFAFGDDVDVATSGRVSLGDGAIIFESNFTVGENEEQDPATGATVTLHAVDGALDQQFEEAPVLLDGSGHLRARYWVNSTGSRAQLDVQEGELAFHTPITDEYYGPSILIRDGHAQSGPVRLLLQSAMGDASTEVQLTPTAISVKDGTDSTEFTVTEDALHIKLGSGGLTLNDDTGTPVFSLTDDILVIEGSLTVEGTNEVQND